MMRCLAARRKQYGEWRGLARTFLALMALGVPREKSLSAEAADRPPKSGPPHGIEQRIPWTTSRVTGSPEPPLPYRTERLFPKLKFVEPLELVALPGSDRWLIIEHAGKIYSFPNDEACESPNLFADLKQLNPEVTESYSLAFHPQFARNRQVYIWYILKPELPDGTHISRFKVTDTNPPQVDLKSERSVGGRGRLGMVGDDLSRTARRKLWLEHPRRKSPAGEAGRQTRPHAPSAADPGASAFGSCFHHGRLCLSRQAPAGFGRRLHLWRLRDRQDLGAAPRWQSRDPKPRVGGHAAPCRQLRRRSGRRTLHRLLRRVAVGGPPRH